MTPDGHAVLLWVGAVCLGFIIIGAARGRALAWADRSLTPRWPHWRDHAAETIGAFTGLTVIWQLGADMDAITDRCPCADALFITVLVGNMAIGGVAYYLTRVLVVGGLAPEHKTGGPQ